MFLEASICYDTFILSLLRAVMYRQEDIGTQHVHRTGNDNLPQDMALSSYMSYIGNLQLWYRAVIRKKSSKPLRQTHNLSHRPPSPSRLKTTTTTPPILQELINYDILLSTCCTPHLLYLSSKPSPSLCVCPTPHPCAFPFTLFLFVYIPNRTIRPRRLSMRRGLNRYCTWFISAV